MLLKHLIAALPFAASVLADAPLEKGNWKEITPTFAEQKCGGGDIKGSLFSVPHAKNNSPGSCDNGHLRAERRYRNDYDSGVHQFGGTFKISSMSGNRVGIKQSFHGKEGAYFILAAENTGRLYSVNGGVTVDESVAKVGASVRINTIHDVAGRRFSVYVNGVEKYTDHNAPNGAFYDKIGAYTTNSGEGGLVIDWSDVQFWSR